jgi:hypothetical protein
LNERAADDAGRSPLIERDREATIVAEARQLALARIAANGSDGRPYRQVGTAEWEDDARRTAIPTLAALNAGLAAERIAKSSGQRPSAAPQQWPAVAEQKPPRMRGGAAVGVPAATDLELQMLAGDISKSAKASWTDQADGHAALPNQPRASSERGARARTTRTRAPR